MLLVCAATGFELDAFPAGADEERVRRVVTGVGIAATLTHLFTMSGSSPTPDLVLNIGIAGAYLGTGIGIGDIVVAGGESWGDVGFELPDAPGFGAITDAPWGIWYAESLPTVSPPEWTPDPATAAAGYRVHTAVRGCTVNTCTGTNKTGEQRRVQCGAGFETMEGAAVVSWGRVAGVPVCEVRAISNFAARRDMQPTNIRLALEHLRQYLETCWAAQQ